MNALEVERLARIAAFKARRDETRRPRSRSIARHAVAMGLKAGQAGIRDAVGDTNRVTRYDGWTDPASGLFVYRSGGDGREVPRYDFVAPVAQARVAHNLTALEAFCLLSLARQAGVRWDLPLEDLRASTAYAEIRSAARAAAIARLEEVEARAVAKFKAKLKGDEC